MTIQRDKDDSKLTLKDTGKVLTVISIKHVKKILD